MLTESEGAEAVGPPLGEMGLDEFLRARHRIVDWIADYRADPECYPFLSRSRLLTKFELPSPERPALSV